MRMSALRDANFHCWRLPLGFPVAGATQAASLLRGLELGIWDSRFRA